MKYLISLLLLLVSGALYAQDDGYIHEDEYIFDSAVKADMEPLKKKLDADFQAYYNKNLLDSLNLRAVTFYEYNNRNELLTETSYSQGSMSYSIYRYKEGQKDNDLTSFTGSNSLELKEYDSSGRLVNEIKYRHSGYRPDKSHYDYKVLKKSGDTTITASFRNTRDKYRTVMIKHSETLYERVGYEYTDTQPSFRSVTWLNTGKPPRIIRDQTFYNTYNHHSEDCIYHYKDTALQSYITTKYDEDTIVEEHKFFYNKKGLKTAHEKHVNGMLNMRYDYEYDKQSNLISEKAHNELGDLIYACLYEYDTKGNKLSYLYYYHGL